MRLTEGMGWGVRRKSSQCLWVLASGSCTSEMSQSIGNMPLGSVGVVTYGFLHHCNKIPFYWPVNGVRDCSGAGHEVASSLIPTRPHVCYRVHTVTESKLKTGNTLHFSLYHVQL